MAQTNEIAAGAFEEVAGLASDQTRALRAASSKLLEAHDDQFGDKYVSAVKKLGDDAETRACFELKSCQVARCLILRCCDAAHVEVGWEAALSHVGFGVLEALRIAETAGADERKLCLFLVSQARMNKCVCTCSDSCLSLCIVSRVTPRD